MTTNQIPTEIVNRIADTLIVKWAEMAEHSKLDGLIQSIIRTTVCDVCAIVEGSVLIEEYEMGDPFTQRVAT